MCRHCTRCRAQGLAWPHAVPGWATPMLAARLRLPNSQTQAHHAHAHTYRRLCLTLDTCRCVALTEWGLQAGFHRLPRAGRHRPTHGGFTRDTSTHMVVRLCGVVHVPRGYGSLNVDLFHSPTIMPRPHRRQPRHHAGRPHRPPTWPAPRTRGAAGA